MLIDLNTLKDFKSKDYTVFKVGESSPYNENHIYLGHTLTEEGKVRRHIIKCAECCKDPEMYIDGIFSITNRSLLKGGSCYCKTLGTKPDDRIYRLKIKRICDKINYEIRGYTEHPVKSSTKVELTCDKGHQYNTTTVSKFISCGRRCPICAGNYKRDYTEGKVLSKIKKARGDKYTYEGLDKVSNNRDKFKAFCPEHGEWSTDLYHHCIRKQDCPHEDCRFNKISEVKAHTTEDFVSRAIEVHGTERYNYQNTVYDRAFNPVEIYCNSCKNHFTQTASDHLSGCGCNLCKNYKQRQCYIFLVKDENGLVVAIKAGKAVNYKTRLQRQNNMSVYEVELYKVWETPSFEICKQCESEVNKGFKGKYLSKDEYRDGFSETYSPTELENIIQVFNKYGNIIEAEGK